MKPTANRLVFKDATGFKKLLGEKKNTQIVLIAKQPSSRGVSEVHHTTLRHIESPYDAYKRLMKKNNISREHILHNGFLNYFPETQTMHHEGMSVFPGVPTATEGHAKALGEVLKNLGYEGKFNDITRRKKIKK